METLELEFRGELNEDGRTVTGVAVPFNSVIDLGGFQERFAPGSIEMAEGAMLFYGHDHRNGGMPIGKITKGVNTDTGFLIEAHISDTAKGNEVRTLLRDGTLSKFSVGVQPLENERDGDITVRTKALLREVSVVPFPAYPQANVLSIREEATDDTNSNEKEVTNMEITQLESEVADLRSAVDEIDRRLIVANTSVPANAALTYRSFGEYVQGVVRGEEEALAFLTRDFSTIADSVSSNAWVPDNVRLVNHNRPTVSAFRQAGLPADGMNVEWAQVKSNSASVSVQAAEGDTLTYGEIQLESKTSAIKTFGGYTSMSRQVIERSTVQFLDTAFRAMAIAYARYVNAAAITALKALSGTGAATAAATAEGWISAIADAAISINGNTGLSPEFILAAPNVYKKVVTLFDTADRPIVGGINLTNGVGTANVPALSGSIGGLPIIVDPALSNGDCWIANSEGFITWESAGAPFRLSNSDITKLTNDFSVYGYAAFAGQTPAAIVRITVQ